MTPALLTTCANEAEADVLQRMLESAGIAVTRQFEEGGDFLSVYTGTSRFPVKMFVAPEALEEARNIMDSAAPVELSEGERREMDESAAVIQKRRSIRAWLALAFLVPGVAFLGYIAWSLLWGLFR